MLLSSTLYTFIGNKNLWQVPNFNLILHMLCIILRKMSKCQGWPHGGPGRAMLPPPTFLCSKKKKRKQTKKSFKTESIQRQSPGSKCYCFSHSRGSTIQIFFLSANKTFQCSMALHFEIHFACSEYLFAAVFSINRIIRNIS